MKRIKAKDNHPLVQRLERVWEAMEKENISIEFFYHRFIVTDHKTGESWELLDLEEDFNGTPIGVTLPPTFEWKLCQDRPEKKKEEKKP